MEAASEPKVPVLGSQSRPKLGRREVAGGGEPLVLSALVLGVERYPQPQPIFPIFLGVFLL